MKSEKVLKGLNITLGIVRVLLSVLLVIYLWIDIRSNDDFKE